MLSRIVLFSAAAVVVLGSAFLVGCSDGSGNGDTVVAAFYPIAFAAEQITDGTVGVRNPDAQRRRGPAHCGRGRIVTSHAASENLARRYGLVQVPLEGLTPEAEPSAGDIGRLVDTVRRSGTTTVFSETLISPKLAQT